MILKNRLKELRARDGLNQSELAKLAGVSQSFKEPVENVFSLVEGEE